MTSIIVYPSCHHVFCSCTAHMLIATACALGKQKKNSLKTRCVLMYFSCRQTQTYCFLYNRITSIFAVWGQMCYFRKIDSPRYLGNERGLTHISFFLSSSLTLIDIQQFFQCQLSVYFLLSCRYLEKNDTPGN